MNSSDYPGPLRITRDYRGLLRITTGYPDYSNNSDLIGSPSGPADYQSCFPLGISRITTDYAGLARLFGLLRLIWITPGYAGLLQINADYGGLLGSTADYPFGSPISPANHQSCFPLGISRITADYARLPRLFGLFWLTWMTKWSSGSPELLPPWDYRITADYAGLPRLFGLLWLTWITKWSSALPELFLPTD